jgi:hypothetical protein
MKKHLPVYTRLASTGRCRHIPVDECIYMYMQACNYIITGSPLAPLVGNAALSGECRVPALREWRTRHSKRTPLRGPLSAALYRNDDMD